MMVLAAAKSNERSILNVLWGFSCSKTCPPNQKHARFAIGLLRVTCTPNEPVFAFGSCLAQISSVNANARAWGSAAMLAASA